MIPGLSSAIFGNNHVKCKSNRKDNDLKLDYSLKTLDERKTFVQNIIDNGEELNSKQLGYMADYLLFTIDSKQTGKEKKKSHPIITKNRDVTISKRQISLEDTVASLSNGEDGLYAMIVEDKNLLLDNRQPITQEDIDKIPGIKENLEVIDTLKKQLERADGYNRYALNQQIISTYKEIYSIKSSYINAITKAHINSQINHMSHMPLTENITIDENGMPKSDGMISLLRADHIAFLLKYYSKLKGSCWDDLNSDMHWLLMDLEDLVERALLPHNEVLYDLLIWEIDGLTGAEIVRQMERKYGIVHSEQYFSTLWCKRIPKIIAEEAQKKWLIWYYTFEHPEQAQWKICKTCGRKLLAHPLFFHKNTSKDGFYSKCRDCRSKKGKIKMESGENEENM